MIARGLTQRQLEDIALQTGVRLVNLRRQGRGLAFTLGLQGELYRRISHTGRRIAAVCYHGHRTFMAHLFGVEPDAILISAMARYNGVDDFNMSACEAGWRNIGSMAQPMSYEDACTCEEEVAVSA